MRKPPLVAISGDFVAAHPIASSNLRNVLTADSKSHHVHDEQNRRFPDGEARVAIDPYPTTPATRSSVVLVHSLLGSPDQPPDTQLVGLLALVDGYRSLGYRTVSVLVPFLTYSRQDTARRDQGEPATSRLVARLLREAGCTNLYTYQAGNPHKLPRQFRTVRLRLLSTAWFYDAVLQQFDSSASHLIVVSPDQGSQDLATHLSAKHATGAIVMDKHRDTPTSVLVAEGSSTLGTSSTDFDAVIVDDLYSSGSTVTAAARHVRARGARALCVAVPHFRPTRAGEQQLKWLLGSGMVDAFYTTDTIPSSYEHPNFIVLSMQADFLSILQGLAFHGRRRVVASR